MAIEGMNCMQLLVMWMLGSKLFPACIVNSPHLRNPENAVVTAASMLSLLNRVVWVADVRMHMRTSRIVSSTQIQHKIRVLHSEYYVS